MAKGKLILICQSGGEFVTNDDGTMTYNGGEANAANVTSETPFNDLKTNLAETCDLNQETVSVKYFLPGNKRNLITVKNDKDVKRMIDFHGDALTAEVFVTGTSGFIRSTVETQINRQTPTKNDETANNEDVNTKKDERVKRGKAGTKKDKKVKKEQKAVKTPNVTSPARRTRRGIAAASEEQKASDNAKSASSIDTSTSADSDKVNKNPEKSEASSDFVPSRYPKRKKPDTNVDTTPADSVKKRRRTPSWKFANGRPTIVSSPEASAKSRGKRRKVTEETSGSRKSQRKSKKLVAKEDDSKETQSGKRKRGRPRATKNLPETSDQEERDELVGPDALALCDADVVDENGIGISRNQVHGSESSDKDSYNKLPWFSDKIMETNPGSIAKLVIGVNKRFKSLFVSFYALLMGFQNSCRPLLFLESTSSKSRYGEILLTANAIDGNDGFFPVAFAIVDVEDDNNWKWFFEQLKPAIANSQITFVYDREKDLKTSILEVFENAYIGYSIYHLLESFKRNVKGPFLGDGKAFLPVYFLEAAHAVRVSGFRKSTDQIKLISSQAYDWVMQIEPQHWTTSSFIGERYNHIIDDVSAPLLKIMEDYQELPILHKIDGLIRYMIDIITDAKLDATMWSTHLTPLKEKQLQEENMKAFGLKVLISSDTLFEVREDSTHVVNLSNWSCTCLGWKETGLPCRHALAVFALTGKNPYEFCSSYYTVDAYRITYMESIMQVPIEKEEVEKIEMDTAGGENEQIEKMEVDGEKEEKSGENEEVAETEGNNVILEKEEWEGSLVNEEEKVNVVEEDKAENGKVVETEGNNVISEREEWVKDLVIGEEEKLDVVEEEKVATEEKKVEKEEGLKVGGENDEGSKVGGENEEGSKVEGEKEKVEKDEGEKEKDDKDEGEKGKIVEYEDPDVIVLPPIPAKAVDIGKEKMEWEEGEVETKRTVTCTKCKQPGHNKKSCNFYQLQQAC